MPLYTPKFEVLILINNGSIDVGLIMFIG